MLGNRLEAIILSQPALPYNDPDIPQRSCIGNLASLVATFDLVIGQPFVKGVSSDDFLDNRPECEDVPLGGKY